MGRELAVGREQLAILKATDGRRIRKSFSDHSFLFAEMLQLAVHSGRSDSGKAPAPLAEAGESWPLNGPLNRPLFTSICRKSMYKREEIPDKSKEMVDKGAGKVDKGEGTLHKGEGKVHKGEGRPDKTVGKVNKSEGRADKGEGKVHKGEGRPDKTVGKVHKSEELPDKGMGEVHKGEKWVHKPGGRADKSAALNWLLFPVLL